MRIGESGWRRALARALSGHARATVAEILSDPPAVQGDGWRIAITGPPGAGKSSVVSALTVERLRLGRAVGVLAIDPSSPISGGSLLGDRVRMDEIADDDRVYIRSIASGANQDGLCPNVLGMLGALDQAGFDDVILETVGIGQTSYQARLLVDTFVLVLIPGSGDIIQAMKAGIMELADLYVINKADIAGADKVAAELRSLVEWRTSRDGWSAPIVMTSARDHRGFRELSDAIEAHRAAHMPRAPSDQRALYQIRALLEQRVSETCAQVASPCDDVAAAYRDIISRLG
jgi:LAO/AO transport system kinase